jgi:hypothetical protein
MIAELTPAGPAELGLWLGCLAAFLFIVNQGRKFVGGFREEPRPLITYATKEELRTLREDLRLQLDRVSADVGSIRDEMKSDKHDILEAGESRTERIHQRIDDMEKELNTIPNQVIVLLRHTGALK